MFLSSSLLKKPLLILNIINSLAHFYFVCIQFLFSQMTVLKQNINCIEADLW